jgi:DNA-binding NarL/FixJ family response regulator
LVNAAEEQTTAVLLDPHPLWLDTLEQVLGNAGVETVGRLTSPSEALALVEAVRPTLLLVDPDAHDAELDGLESLRRACARFPSLVAIVFSGSDNPERIDAAFAAGALGYVLKTAAREDLVAAVRGGFQNLLSRSARAAGLGLPLSE